MAKFSEWCKDRNLTLPEMQTSDDDVATFTRPRSKDLHKNKPLDEKQARAGIAHWAYPDGYVRGRYPKAYFMPRAADAAVKMGE